MGIAMSATTNSAVIAGVIAGGTSLIALLTNVQSFGEISAPAYAVVFIGAVMVALKDIQSSNREPEE
jgi:hypothetical protein